MQTDRRAILTLVALGRITPVEAERLLLAWNAGRQSLWVPVVCVAAFYLALSAHFDPRPWSAALSHLAHSLLPVALATMHHILPVVTQLFGGTQ